MALLAGAPAPSMGADERGRFALKSVGTTRCSAFVAAREQGGEGYALYGGYLGGYVSAYNQLVPETFDLTPFHDADTLAGMLARYCGRHPDENFGAALWRLVALLRPDRVVTESPEVRAAAGDQEVAVYAETLRRAQERLRALGHYDGDSHGRYDAATRAALAAFQAREGIARTGVPDQVTLYRLTYGDQRSPPGGETGQ